MLHEASRGDHLGFRTLVSLTSHGSSEEFFKKLSEHVKDDVRFSLHHAKDVEDRVSNLGLLVSYASHIKADMILHIKCHDAAPEASESSESRRPVVKVRAHEVKEISNLCGDKACTAAFPGDEEAEVTVVTREIQKKIMDSVSLDSVVTSMLDTSGGTARLNERLRELRSYTKKRIYFVSIDVFPQDIDSDVRQCSELIDMLHEHYSRKQALLLREEQLVIR